MGSSSISSSVLAVSTGTWDITSDGSAAKAETNPTTFYTSMYLPKGSWESVKTTCDPCPVGWRVPEGGDNGVWAKALGSSSSTNKSFDSSNRGINFTGALGDAEIIWYPASGCRDDSSVSLSFVSLNGFYWSCSPVESNSSQAYRMYFYYNGSVDPSDNYNRANGYPVRCLQE